MQTRGEIVVQRLSLLYQTILRHYSKNQSYLKSACKIAAASYKLYVAFFGPLSKVPGPFVAKFMGLPSPIYDMPTGTLFASLKKLHDIHGAIVRTGPTSISVADKDMIKQILVQDDLPKGPIYANLRSAYVSAYPSFFKLFIRGPSPKIMNFVKGIYEKRRASGEKRDDILQALVDTQDDPDPEKRMATRDLVRETFLFLTAGSDTTGNTLGFALIELLRNPDKMAKLHQEIDTLAFMEGTELFYNQQLKALPYLNGVIHETLRLRPVPGVGLQRRTEKEINLRGELVVPKDIVVTANMYHAHNNNAYWPNASRFIPERWIPGEDDYNQVTDHDSLFTFSAGSRNCIGKNFALQELRLALANFFKYYEIKPIPKEMEEATNLRQYLTLTVAKGSFLAKVKRRTEAPLSTLMLNEKEETGGDVEVSWVDQQRINEFSQYNAKIDDLEEQYEKLKVCIRGRCTAKKAEIDGHMWNVLARKRVFRRCCYGT
ncbi:cytochrome P450 CYP5313 [Mucor lusitanicus CBS 277.49]|uniref:Cytochrome P450 CYP5313 n=1 Tax=Mucor lusitanicus CBS 277.49 TaxID=747725 RepID=A0A168ILY1_MUCCL|nr:cytochrome P450 CYP5313 [Mucor lusitanicus CBS 277.49]